MAIRCLPAIAAILAHVSAAVAQDTAQPSEIHLSATVTVTRAPDWATVRMAVVTRAERAAEAARDNATSVQNVVLAVSALGFEAESIVTASYTVQPEYEVSRERRRVVGYSANTTLAIHVRNLDQLGEVIDQALGAGATGIEQIVYGLADVDAARRAATAEAVEQLRGDAEVMAGAARGRLGRVIRLVSHRVDVRQPPSNLMLRRGAPEPAPLPSPITPGQLGLSVTISAVFALIPDEP